LAEAAHWSSLGAYLVAENRRPGPPPIDLEHQARLHAANLSRWLQPAEALAEARRLIAEAECWWHAESVMSVENSGQRRLF
jgi:hypothetical protein